MGEGVPDEVVVRAEEVLLVALVLVIWAAAVALFFNRWGKIRMLEPYQPKFRQQPHRPSCPLAVAGAVAGTPGAAGTAVVLPGVIGGLGPGAVLPPAFALGRPQKCARMSFSKYNVNALTDPLSALPSPIIRRQRQHSVFAGSASAPGVDAAATPRRARSAADIRLLAVGMPTAAATGASSLSGSLTPILTRGPAAAAADRRSSIITIERPERPERPVFIPRRRPSIAVERPAPPAPPPPPPPPPSRARRASCCPAAAAAAAALERRAAARHHRNFTSLEVPRTPSRGSVSSSFQQPTISFETPLESYESSDFPSTSATTHLIPVKTRPKISRSFEQPPKDRPKPERMANSLDVSASFSLERRYSIPEEPDRASAIFITLDDTRITAPLLELESLKSSDV